MLSSAVYAVAARRDRAGQPRGRLRPGPGRPLDGAAAEERGRARRARRHARLPARDRQGSSAPTTSGTRGTSSSPYWTPDLAEAIQEVNGGRLADRVLVATANVDANQQAIEITGQGSTVVLMGLAGPNDAVSLPLLSNLTRTRRSGSRGSTRCSGRRRSGCSTTAKVDTGTIITHTASLDGISAAIERVLQREDEVVKTVIMPMSARPPLLRLADHDLPPDLRRGPRELPEAGAEGIGVWEFKLGEDRSTDAESVAKLRDSGLQATTCIPGHALRSSRSRSPGRTIRRSGRRALRGDRAVRAVRAGGRSSA